ASRGGRHELPGDRRAQRRPGRHRGVARAPRPRRAGPPARAPAPRGGGAVTGELDRDVVEALRALDPGPPPEGLADRAFRRAMAEGRPPTLVERFVLAGRRVVLAGAALAAAVWIGLFLRGGDPAAGALDQAMVAADPVELTFTVWTGEEGAP